MPPNTPILCPQFPESLDIETYAAYQGLCREKSHRETQTSIIPPFRWWVHRETQSTQAPLIPSKDSHHYYRKEADRVAQNMRLYHLHKRHQHRYRPCTELCEQSQQTFPQNESTETQLGRKINIVLGISMSLTIISLIAKIIAVRISRSITVIASVLDSVLDIFSGLFLFVLNAVVRNVSTRKYPIGSKRLQPLGVLIFSAIMASASLSVVQHCLTSFYQHLTGNTTEITHPTISVVVLMEIVVVLKFGMYMYCRTLACGDVICATLIRDHRNDVLSNVAGLTGVVLALLLHVIWDDVIGIFITAYIIVNWSKAAYAQMKSLSCKTAPHDVINHLTFVAFHHHPEVLAIEKIQAYSVGCGYCAEIDIVLPADMSLQCAHDIGESLQLFLEAQTVLPITRAYVHTDYETCHHAGEHR